MHHRMADPARGGAQQVEGKLLRPLLAGLAHEEGQGRQAHAVVLLDMQEGGGGLDKEEESEDGRRPFGGLK